MSDEVFRKRLKNLADKGELTAFNIAVVAEALDTVKDLSAKNIGWEQVEERLGEYKSWDPDILKVDKDAEKGYWKRLEERGTPFVFLSEEAGRVEINTDKKGERFYVVCDPFDGSYLFKHGIPDFWYSSLAFFGEDFNPRSSAVGDCVARKIAFADEKGAFIGELEGDKLVRQVRIDKKYRVGIGRPDVTKLEGASIESYAMKPKKFLFPLVRQYAPLMEPFKFFLPNGGPYGFVDVAEGKIDVYFAVKQPFVDVFSGIYIAQQSEVIVTDFDGKPVKCSDNVKSVLDVVASTNAAIHEAVLKKIAECK